MIIFRDWPSDLLMCRLLTLDRLKLEWRSEWLVTKFLREINCSGVAHAAQGRDGGLGSTLPTLRQEYQARARTSSFMNLTFIVY